ncbi:hypothetical protein VT84_30595 [Gemmata sp. SH-PL17]|uniref:hypothetical protein n=1 Tax=Gemmata sp. SH-PL17 TaxID=1630693 RepID=UPI00078DB61C|nr:hypothetical protein [Gemmata sp. SH-PL17]AMV28782.1 hypothetical protein VT84_30595 [Gemmata sp. SH-PL17]
MLLLPPCVEAVAAVAGDGVRRFSVPGVLVDQRPDGSATIDATDAIIAVRATVRAQATDDYPDLRSVEIRNGEPVKGVIPAGFFRDSLRAAKKMLAKLRTNRPVLKNVALVQAPEVGTLPVTITACATNLEQELAPSTQLVLDRPLPFDTIWQRNQKAEPIACVTLEADRLQKVLSALAAMSGGDKQWVRIEIREDAPVIVIVETPADGLEFVGGMVETRRESQQ